jgi:hypothetical protein
VLDIKLICDATGEPRASFLKDRSFSCMLAFDIFRRIESEWLAAAVAELDANAIEAVSYDANVPIARRTLAIDRDSIYDMVLDQNIFHTMLSCPDISFLAYFSKHRDYYLLAGSQGFLRRAHPVSLETAKLQFFENLDVQARSEPINVEWFAERWRRYME